MELGSGPGVDDPSRQGRRSWAFRGAHPGRPCGGQVEVTVPVTSTGDRDGDEVVQLYVHDVAAAVVQPVRRLRGFERVTLRPGEERRVRFTLGAEDLGYWTDDPTGACVLERGVSTSTRVPARPRPPAADRGWSDPSRGVRTRAVHARPTGRPGAVTRPG
ncbi:fibronectin type III-like domain-contianing protein [Streptomyces sp. NPDC059166]|uniref:fibronectin type III-like domain-contianing protein n=1 Tax=Streptomyces sp. NPDC059166 TaxID=3346752 RepID=UPI0036C9E17E